MESNGVNCWVSSFQIHSDCSNRFRKRSRRNWFPSRNSSMMPCRCQKKAISLDSSSLTDLVLRAGQAGSTSNGTAVDAGTFHYAVRLREQVAGTTQWTDAANGRDLLVEWDETVTA